MWRVSLTTAYGAAALIGCFTIAAAWRARRTSPAGVPLSIASIGILTWSAAAGTDALLASARYAPALASAGVLGQCAIVIGYAGLAEVVDGQPWRPKRPIVILLLTEPVLVLVALLTNPWSQWFFAGIDARLGFPQATIGPGYWMHIAYSYGAVLFAAYRAVSARLTRSTYSRRSARWVAAIIGPPVAANLVAVLVLHAVDLTLIGTTTGTVLAYYALTCRSLELLPVARAYLIDSLSDGVIVVDGAGRIADMNPVGRAMVEGLLPRSGDPVGKELASLDPAFPALTCADADFVYRSRPLRRELEIRARVIRARSDRPDGWVLSARDVTDARAQQRALETANAQLQAQLDTIEQLRADLAEQAIRDALTGLHNRRYLMARLGDTERDGLAPVSVALVDIDHFKQINDMYGHAAGDSVLVGLAKVLAAHTRPTDMLARYGGEEFVLIMPGLPSHAALDRVDELRRRVAETPIEAAGRALTVSFSAGVATATHCPNADALLESADAALYAAKRNGRGRVEVATSVL